MTEPESTSGGESRPAANPWLIALAVMSATFMEVLDTSVANVALPHIAGSLSASTNEATWVLTSYLVSNAIILPMTGWLGRYFGRKRFLMTCIGIFTLSSALCGVAENLELLIIARILQGMGGGALQPIAQAVLFESFPVEKRGQATAIYTMGVIVAPILGPTLGGWITDSYSWRWIFYINVPIGIASVLLCKLFIEDPPYIRDAKPGRIDFIGFALLTIWIGSLQIMLDKGQDDDWFASDFIRWLAIFATVGFVVFVFWEMRNKHPLVNLRVLKNRNLAVGSILLLCVGGVLYATTAILPLILQTLLGYTALQSGLTISPRGFGAIVGSVIGGQLISRVDSRYLVGIGFSLLAYACYQLALLNTQIAQSSMVIPIIVSGLAVALVFVPMTTLSVSTISKEEMGDATGLTSLVRNLGGSIGISVVTALVARSSQLHQAMMVRNLTPADIGYSEQLAKLTAQFAANVSQVEAQRMASAVIYQELQQQVSILAYLDQFRLFACICLGCILIVPLFRRARTGGKVEEPVH